MLEHLWPQNTTGARCIVGIRGGQVKHYWCQTNDEALERARQLEAAGEDVYYAPFLFDPEKVADRRQEINPRTGRPYAGREQSCAWMAAGLWLDIDCGEGKDYPSQGDALTAFLSWVQDNALPPPSYVISSGHGLHIYWLLDTPAVLSAWLPVAQHLKQAAALQGLRCDPTRTADAASILRVPGTTNRKNGESAPVQILAAAPAPVSLERFEAALPAVGPQRVARTSREEVASSFAVPDNYPPGDAEQITRRCAQMAHVRDEGGAVSEPLWRAALSVLWRCTGGETLIHEWSRGDERYDAGETREKAERTGGPARCETFAAANPAGCQACPFRGEISTPIHLGVGAAPAPAQQNVFETPGKLPPPYASLQISGFTINDQGVWTAPDAEGATPEKVIALPLWLSEVRSVSRELRERGASSLRVHWMDARGEERSAVVSQGEVWDTRAFTKWLADHNLIAWVRKVPALTYYIGRLTAETFRQQGERTIYEELGWYDNRRLFVLGTQGVRADGLHDVVVENSTTISQLEPRGEASKWAEAVSMLGHPRYFAHAFTVMAGLGAPLLSLAGREGAVVALVGQSGYGKTLAAKTALSAFVDPLTCLESGKSTINAIGARMAAHRHVPVLVDEVTNMRVKDLADLIYMAANGKGKAALYRSGQMRKVSTWSTVTFLTSNHSLVDQARNEIEEAHRRRLIEIPVLNQLPRSVTTPLIDAGRHHGGAAAEPYLQLVMQQQERIPAMFDLVERWVSERAEAEQADRYVVWTLSCALLGGLLGAIAGIIRFDPLPVIERVIEAVKDDYREMPNEDERAFDALCEFLVENSRHVCTWHDNRGAGDFTDAPVARVTEESLYVRKSKLNEVFLQQKINRAALRKWFSEVVVSENKRMRLSPAAPQPVACYQFNLEKLGLDVDHLIGAPSSFSG